MKKAALFISLSMVVAATGASAQGLGGVAQKEKAKRQAAKAKEGGEKDKPKVITDDELAGYAESKPASETASETVSETTSAATYDPGAPESARSGDGKAPSSESPSSEPAPPPRSSDDSADRAEKEKLWRGRAEQQRAALAAAEKELQAAESAQAALVYAPANSTGSEYDRWAQEKKRADERVKKAQSVLQSAKMRFEDLEGEARRAGALPGWLR